MRTTTNISGLIALALVALTRPLGAQEASVEPAFVPPRLLSSPPATYPQRAEREGVEAEVVLELDLDATGQVEGVTIAVPATPEGYGFDEAASDAAFLFEFEPATEDGQPVPVRITYRLVFALEAPPDDEATSPATDASASRRIPPFRQSPRSTSPGSSPSAAPGCRWPA